MTKMHVPVYLSPTPPEPYQKQPRFHPGLAKTRPKQRHDKQRQRKHAKYTDAIQKPDPSYASKKRDMKTHQCQGNQEFTL